MRKWCSILFMTLFIFGTCHVYAGSQARSGKTAANIITEAKWVLINNAKDNFWSDAEMLGWVNEGILDIVSKTHCLEDTATIVLVTDTKDYAWTGTSNYLTVDPHGAFLQLHNSSKYKTLTNNKSIIGHVIETGPPAYWYEFNGRVHVWPVPTSAYSGSTVFVDFVPIPDGCSTASLAIETPKIYDPALVFYVISRAMSKEKNPASIAYMNLYQQTIDRYRADFIDEPKESMKEKQP